MPIVGTAGHVDHGKSALVKALTGVDPDRLAEEKRRGMTIDLGFAHLALPGIGEVGIVDVPGHARFLPNMLAGVHGLDAVILVVAADEGVMPQTREHLDIVGLVGVDRLVVAITKVDLVPDDAELATVEHAIAGELSRRGLGARVVRVVAPTGVGLDSLRTELAGLLAAGPAAADGGSPRLPVDRVFLLTGFGPVVTGSLVDGPLRVGQEVELVPSGRGTAGQSPRRARIRGLQQHGHPVEAAVAGSRVAVNLQGVDRDHLDRGQVLTRPGGLEATDRISMMLHVLADAGGGVAHNARVTAYSGTSSSPARVRVIDDHGSEVRPGGEGLVEVRLLAPMALVEGDAVVLRRPSPAGTVAGGRVGSTEPSRFVRRHGRWHEHPVGNDQARVAAALVRAVGAFHDRNPSRAGMPRAEVPPVGGVSRRGPGAALDAAVASGALVADGDLLALPGWRPRLTTAQALAVERVLGRLGEVPLSPPRTGDLAADGLDDAVRRYIEEQGLAVRVAPDLLLLPDALAQAEARLRAHIQANGPLTVAAARDTLASSRRTVVPLLEYFDAVRLTRRDGDVRVLAR